MVHYTGTLDDGSEFDSSRDRFPLEFVVGGGQMIAGFDNAVRGLAVGETVTVRIEPADAYGESIPDLIVDVPVDEFPAGDSGPARRRHDRPSLQRHAAGDHQHH